MTINEFIDAHQGILELAVPVAFLFGSACAFITGNFVRGLL